jgi:hypothetical protein
LVGLEATALLKKDSLQGERGTRLLKTAVESGANLLISKVNLDANLDATALNTLTDGAILGLFKLLDGHYDWEVSPDAPEVTGVFSGQTITSATTTTQSGSALLLVNTTNATPLILPKGRGNATGVCAWQKARCDLRDAGQLAPSLDRFNCELHTTRPASRDRPGDDDESGDGRGAWHTNGTTLTGTRRPT